MKLSKKQGLTISQMTLGTVQLGIPYGINNTSGMPDLSESFRMLETAHRGGVTILDTSDDYGTSEQTIGAFHVSHPDQTFRICTKFRTDKLDPLHLYRELREQALRSIDKLHVDHLDFFMSHIESDYLNHGCRLTDALNHLKADGLIKAYAISLQDKTHLEQIVTEGGFDAVQLPLNLFDCEELRNGLISRLAASGTAIFVRSVYLQGLFFKDPSTLTGGLQRAVPYLEKLHALAASLRISTAQLALSFIKDAEGVTSLVLGSENTAQIAENLKLMNAPALPQEVRVLLLQELADVPRELACPWMWSTLRS